MSVITPMYGINMSFSIVYLRLFDSGVVVYRFHNFYDVHADGAAFEASSAADAAVNAAVIHRIIYELVHKALTEALLLRVPRIFRRHLRKVRKHTAVPAAKLPYAASGIETPDVKTHARRTHVCTSAAAQARFRKVFPHRQIENRKHVFAAKFRKVDIDERQFVDFFPRRLLLFFDDIRAALARHAFDDFDKRVSLFGVCAKKDVSVCDPRARISLRLGSIDAVEFAKTGFFRFRAGERGDGAVVITAAGDISAMTDS